MNDLKFIRDIKVKNKLTVGACCCSTGRQETNLNEMKLQCFWAQLKESSSFLYSHFLLPPPPPSPLSFLPPSPSLLPLITCLPVCLNINTQLNTVKSSLNTQIQSNLVTLNKKRPDDEAAPVVSTFSTRITLFMPDLHWVKGYVDNISM